MKKVLFLAILILYSQFLILNSLRAQGFEWVRTYTGQEVTSGVTTNQLIGSCVDSAGNLYILGELSPQAQLCGTNLLPFEVIETSRPRWQGVVIAKLSPSGELLWHKAIYNGKQGCYAHALRMVGDSNIMVMVTMGLPYYYGGGSYRNLYYLDTLLVGNDDYLMPTDSVSSSFYNAFISFDYDGNVTERHFVCVGFKDSNGNALTERFRIGIEYPDKLSAIPLSDRNFNIDSKGNIYVVRSVHTDRMAGVQPCDTCETPYWSVDDGTIGTMQIVIDGTHYLTYHIQHPTALWNQQILKFSPHFDSLIDAIYMFDSTLNYQRRTEMYVTDFNIDTQNNLYMAMYGQYVPNRLAVANSDSLSLGDSTTVPSWVIKYNQDLFATGVVQLSHDGTGNPQLAIGRTHIDNKTNSLFVSGRTWWSQSSVFDNILYNSDTLEIPNKSGYWLRLNDDLSLSSVGIVSPNSSDGRVWGISPLATNNNRVFAQSNFDTRVAFADTIIPLPNLGEQNRAVVIWDNDGHEIGLIMLGQHSPLNGATQTHVIDSILYLTGYVYEDAAFDTIMTHNYGSSQAYIAKYVDPTFAQPYVHPSDRQEQMIEWQQDLVFTLADSPVTLTATATSGLPVSYTSSDSTIAYVEGDRLHLVADGYAWLTATQEGDYQYFPAEPVQRLLTVGNVGIATVGADGQAKAYPNPTSGQVTIDLAKIPPAPPLPYHKPGPSDSRDVDMVLYTSPGAPFPQYETCRFPYHQRYNMKVSGSALQSHDGVVTAWLTDMQGRREEVVLTPTGPDQYTLDLTSRPPAAYLLTVTTTDGRELTFRLMKQYGRK